MEIRRNLINPFLIFILSFALSSCNPLGTSSEDSGTFGLDNEVVIGAPTIQGYVISGLTLSVSSYATGSSASDSHQWYAGGTAIAGATGTTHTITSSDEGSSITLKLNGGDSSNSLSNFYPGDITLTSWIDPLFSTSTCRVTGNTLQEEGTGTSPQFNSGAIDFTVGQKAYTLQTLATSSPQVIMIVDFLPATATGTKQLIDFRQEAGAGGSGDPLVDAPDGGTRVRVRWDNGSGLTSSTIITPPTTFHLAEYSHDGSNYYHRVSGVIAGQAASVGSISNLLILGITTNGFTPGDSAISASFKDIITATYLSTTDREKIEGYLSWKHGLEGDLLGGHSYSASPP